MVLWGFFWLHAYARAQAGAELRARYGRGHARVKPIIWVDEPGPSQTACYDPGLMENNEKPTAGGFQVLILDGPALHDRRLGLSAKAVFGLLRALTQSTGETFWSNGHIADRLHISRATVVRCLSSLEQHGHILREFREDGKRILRLNPAHYEHSPAQYESRAAQNAPLKGASLRSRKKEGNKGKAPLMFPSEAQNAADLLEQQISKLRKERSALSADERRLSEEMKYMVPGECREGLQEALRSTEERLQELSHRITTLNTHREKIVAIATGMAEPG